MYNKEKVFFKKNTCIKKRGFTLIEMLLVIAIIGILASAVYTMIGDSSDAKTKSALSTAKSIVPYAQECSFKGNNLNDPSDIHDGGNPLCAGSETNWPSLGPDECNYNLSAISGGNWEIDCVFSSKNVTIQCDAANGTCEVI